MEMDYRPPIDPDPMRRMYPLSHVMALCEKRLDAGAEQYGDGDYHHKDVLSELEDEVLDSINYLYMFWLKIQGTRAACHMAGMEP